MRSLLMNRITIAWLVLAILTSLSWWLADSYNLSSSAFVTYVAVTLLALTFFKVRLIIMYFMEVRDAPWGLRGLFEVWVVGVFVALVAVYYSGI